MPRPCPSPLRGHHPRSCGTLDKRDKKLRLVEETRRPMLTPRRAAELLGVHRETIYRLIAHGDLASVRVGSLLRVAAVDVDAYLARA